MAKAADKIFFPREQRCKTYPLETNPGSVTWLLGEIDPDTVHGCHVLKFTGRNAKLTVFFNGKNCRKDLAAFAKQAFYDRRS